MSDINAKFRRRQFLAYQSIVGAGQTAEQAAEAVASAATEHPEWDMDEEMTWAEWGSHRRPGVRRATEDERPSPREK